MALVDAEGNRLAMAVVPACVQDRGTPPAPGAGKTAVLLEQNDEWQLRYCTMQVEAMAGLLPPFIEGEIASADTPQAA